jgi:hypothetical protein
MCASTASTMCSDMPTDDADVDSQPPDLTTITIDVLAPDRTGQNDIRIVFSSPDGEFIEETRTPPSGHVVVDDIPVGSTATIYRLAGSNYAATTYLDLWEDAHIVSRFAPDNGARIVTVNWQAPNPSPPSLFYYLYTTCFNGEQTTTNLTMDVIVSDNCPRFDLTLIAKNASMVPIASVSVADVNGLTPINIASSTWNAFESGDMFDANVMNTTGNVTMQLSPYVTPAHAYSTSIATATVPAGGDVPVLPFPSDVGAAVALHSSTTIGNDFYQQLYVERVPVGTTTYERDMATRKFGWINEAALDLPTRTLTWRIVVTPGMGTTQPMIAYARVSFRRGVDSHVWHIFGRGERVTASTTMGTFVLPDIPGDNPFEPVVGDNGLSDEISYFSVTPGLADRVRARLESHETSLDIFGIDGLTYVHRATAF